MNAVHHAEEASPLPYPDGWFALCFSRELKPGSVLTTPFMGRDVVLYRTRSGQVRATDAHCPHQGAHLGHGGTVEGENLVCPFHHYAYGQDGRCVRAGQAEGGRRAALRTWHVREWNGFVFVWQNAKGLAPTWELPEVDMDGFSVPVGRSYTLRGLMQNLPENGYDIEHFGALHRWTDMSPHAPLVDGPRISMHVDMAWKGIRWRTLIGVHGLGCVSSDHEMKSLGLEAKIFACGVQVAPMQWTFRDGISFRFSWLAKWPPFLRHAIYAVLSRTLHRLWLVPVFKEDIMVWSHRDYSRYAEPAAGSGPYPIFRRWATQFYPAPATPTRAANAPMAAADSHGVARQTGS
ncbi:Rieske 2Fe-2S domain-containing protein [Dyella sp. BiH032]|uniref:Rieske (2Fe-2S) protein n=1 Tax=Dyella sp. BiH032 TaxID=3075430 RepID=UPI0028935840|nr:Rieske 2Fe-2S domain-containing protein [Dyella sp. BiH032]WNL44224.1 Rieske 2Fe-2S domain-containing protein [Dyella sp. BiH032]